MTLGESVLGLLRSRGEVWASVREIAVELAVPRSSIGPPLRALCHRGMVVAEGVTRNRRYRAIERTAPWLASELPIERRYRALVQIALDALPESSDDEDDVAIVDNVVTATRDPVATAFDALGWEMAGWTADECRQANEDAAAWAASNHEAALER